MKIHRSIPAVLMMLMLACIAGCGDAQSGTGKPTGEAPPIPSPPLTLAGTKKGERKRGHSSFLRN